MFSNHVLSAIIWSVINFVTRLLLNLRTARTRQNTSNTSISELVKLQEFDQCDFQDCEFLLLLGYQYDVMDLLMRELLNEQMIPRMLL